MEKNAGLKIIAVMPAHNEEKHVYEVVKSTRKFVDEVIVVNDGSRDKTALMAGKAGAIVVTHLVNMGLGFTLYTGALAAIKHNADIVVTIDSDGQHDPAEIPELVKELIEKNADIVIGTRDYSSKMPFFKKLGNTIIFLVQKTLFGTSVFDTQSGFRAFRASAWEKLKWKSKGYAVSSEIVKNIGEHKLSYAETMVKTIYRETYKGTGIVDGLKIVFNLILWKIRG